VIFFKSQAVSWKVNRNMKTVIPRKKRKKCFTMWDVIQTNQQHEQNGVEFCDDGNTLSREKKKEKEKVKE